MSPVERTTIVSPTTTALAGTGNAPPIFRRISWGAIFAGMVIAVAVQVVLSLLGTGIGMGTIDPLQVNGTPSAGALGTGAGIWWAISSIIALFVGGWVAGHLAGSPEKSDALLHGLATWGVATIITVYLLASLVGSVVRGGAAVVGKTAEVAAAGVGAVAGKAADAAKDNIDSSDFSIDNIKGQVEKLLSQTGKPALQPESVASQASGAANQLSAAASSAGATGNPPAQDLNTVLQRIIKAGKSTVDQADREALVNVVAARSNLSKPEAEQRVDAWIKQYQEARAKFEEAKAQAKAKALEAADAAAKASAKAALGAAAALVLGAIAAALGGLTARRRFVGTVATRTRV